MATCAAITGAKLPDDAARDSFNILPVLLGQDDGKPVRPYTLHETISLALAIRKGPWKYLDHAGSGGNNYGQAPLKQLPQPSAVPHAPGQLYDLSHDPGETDNLFFREPEIARQLKGLLEQSKSAGGRTR
jgi:hypothetical protein